MLKTIIAILISFFLIIITFILIPSIYNSYRENTKIKGNHRFHIKIGHNFVDSYLPMGDVIIDLSVSLLHRNIMVDDPVDVYGKAVLISERAQIQLSKISIGFEGGFAYPPVQDELGSITAMDLQLKPNSENSNMEGESRFFIL
jgi:hypothetical protein